MSRKHFIWLFLATLVTAALVLFYPSHTGRESRSGETTLIPGLTEQVNSVEWLRLSAAGDETLVTLKRENKRWVVEEVSAYRADWDLVKTLLGSLSRAEILEQKTANANLYSRLGVEDVSLADAAGVMIEFAQDSGFPAVIIGNQAQGRGGQYARLAGSDSSVLIDLTIDLPKEQSDWLDKKIVDISDAEVVEFEIIHPGGESVRAVKASADDENFDLQNVPDDREIESDWSVNAPANSLAALELQAVIPAAQLNWDNAVRFRLLTADGLTVDTEILTVENGAEPDGPAEQWIRLQAELYSPADGSQVNQAQQASETATRAEQLNNRTKGWAYQIPGYRVEPMTRHMENLLKSTSENQ
jgi:hypothetical protein